MDTATLASRENTAVLLYLHSSKPEEMAVSNDNNARAFWSRLRTVAGVMAAIGIAGSVWNELLPWPWAQHLARDFSVALFVAGLLAISVDVLFKAEFARDVFNAAFSYVLPDELKQEIRRIIEYKFLCVKHEMILKLLPINNDLFRLEISIQRTIKNISRHRQDIKNSFAIDDWGFSIKPEITKCTMKFGGKPYDGTKARTDLTSEAVGRETETVSLKYKEEVMVISQGYEIKAANSEFMISFTVPTVNPTVEIEMPSIQPHVWFRGAGRGSSQIQHSRKIRAKRNAFSRTVHATQMVERRLGGKSSDYFSQ